jgi:ATP-dependent Clp protease ATP-binding subunit ClpA
MDAAIERTFLPEFINRLTEVVKFNFLDAEVGKKIINKKLNELQEKLDKRGIKIKLNKSAEEYILEKGINNKFGAREISRIFTKEINSILADMIIDNDISSNTNLEVYCKNNSLSVRKKK